MSFVLISIPHTQYAAQRSKISNQWYDKESRDKKGKAIITLKISKVIFKNSRLVGTR